MGPLHGVALRCCRLWSPLLVVSIFFEVAERKGEEGELEARGEGAGYEHIVLALKSGGLGKRQL